MSELEQQTITQSETTETYEQIRARYFNPEQLDTDTLENILERGEVRNIHLIEELGQIVAPHADKVLTGEMTGQFHKDEVLEAELVLPGEEKPLLVIYKPENGIGHGTEQGKTMIPLPPNASPAMNKEVAAWVVAKELGFQEIVFPTVIRQDLPEGPGSVRPYIWGDPLELLPFNDISRISKENPNVEKIAIYDYLLQTMDRRLSNLIVTQNANQESLIAIDHSLTFFHRDYRAQYILNGPRLWVGFDNKQDPPKLKGTPVPVDLFNHLELFLQHKKEIYEKLANLLTSKEIDDMFDNAQQLLEQKIFL